MSYRVLSVISRCPRTLYDRAHVFSSINSLKRRWNGTHACADYESKYAQKLHQRAEEKGVTLEELKTKAREEDQHRIQQEAEGLKAQLKVQKDGSQPHKSTETSDRTYKPASIRRDGSPVQPLASILNVSKLLSTPHTTEQVSALWTAYHMSRSGGTGRGYVCAAIPLDAYTKMLDIATKYPAFVVPVPRPTAQDPSIPPETKDHDTPYEFYFLQWGFHHVPPVPTATEDPFNPSKLEDTGSGNPQTSTVLFTPLQEFKSRQTFATPYLVLTHYTDLAKTHGIVLLRGEITPSSASGGSGVDGRYMLSQQDAQLLSMTLQKFYLWNEQGLDDSKREGERLLRVFHEKPEEFKWEELLKHASFSI
ncbi:hypothetical protein AX16_000563 [Volvariella volvacea WC 439]|nr:hypothetical protein AX16_000563 [Volvariella volvacea WC 439]